MNRADVDRRAIFFFVSAALSLLLVPVAPDEFRWVGTVLAIWLVVLGAASWADLLSRRRRTPR